MLVTAGCAFSLLPCAPIGRVCGDHHFRPHSPSPAQSIRPQNRLRRRSFPPEGAPSAHGDEGGGWWQAIDTTFRPEYLLVDRRSGVRRKHNRRRSASGRCHQAAAARDGGRESPPAGQIWQRKQIEEDGVLVPPSTALPSGIADGGEASVVLDLQGDRRRHKCVVHNTLAQGPIPYTDGWEWQKQTLARLAERPNDISEDAEPDRVLLLQHHAVFTLGTGSTVHNLRFDLGDEPFGEVVRTERGGEVTYHGPGQIVLYPILNLRRYRQDIHWYLRALEETVILTLARLGLRGERIDGLTGVWVEGRKVAAVGVRVKRWITMHGLSLNVCPNLEHFKHIIPCGIEDRPVGSLEQLCTEGEDAGVERVGRLLLESFEEVFGVSAVFETLTPPQTPPPLPPPPPSLGGKAP